MNRNKTALICPLNWGLGHATRVVPIIKTLLENEIKVVVASYGNSAVFLRNEFPQLKHIHLPGYSVRYSKRTSQLLPMLLLAPSILYWSIKEHRIIKSLVLKHKIDIVISDNRFGCWARSAYNIFITHQLKVKFPKVIRLLEPIYQIFSEAFITKYNECWIPDFENNKNISGELAHKKTGLTNIIYIGPLSRFKAFEKGQTVKDIEILFLLSGPEPQRSILEDIIYKQTRGLFVKMIMVRGSNSQQKNRFNYPVFDLLNTNDLFDLIKRSKLVVCRAGYSSIMDLVDLRQKAVLIPTPGQTEQEYLAQYLHKQNIFYSMQQCNFTLEEAIERAFEYPKNMIKADDTLIELAVRLKKMKRPK
jgi:uncharacterized protein (TIGR00661 family)